MKVKAGNRERRWASRMFKVKAKQRGSYMRPSQTIQGKMTMLMRQKIYRRGFHWCKKNLKKTPAEKEKPGTSVARSKMRELHSINCIIKGT